jgi:endonuclease III
MNQKLAISQLNELKRLGKEMRLAAEKWRVPWNTLIATIMSTRTNDYVTIPTANNLFDRYQTLEKLAKANLKDIEKTIRPVNFYKTKAKNVVNCTKMLVSEFGGKVPKDFDELIKLPGVGRKTVNVFLSECGKSSIAVDTHVSYISQKLGWTKNKKPERIEEDLKNLFPKEYWTKVNPTLVRFGKTYTSRKKKDEVLEKIKDITN